jgi:hypothetical protein
MINIQKPLFPIGKLVATPGALAALEEAKTSIFELLVRHLRGDWGCVCDDDAQANDASIRDGTRILSAYRLGTGVKVWLITEAADEDGERSATTALLPDEY